MSTVLTDGQVGDLFQDWHCFFKDNPGSAALCVRAIEQAVLQSDQVQKMRQALEFYANGEHFIRHDDSAWDTVSGEPQNLYEDEAGTATVEDGSIARLAMERKT